MQKTVSLTLLSLLVPLAAGSTQAGQQETASGFHGGLTLGTIWASTDSQISPHDGNKTISSLKKGKDESEWAPLIDANLGYTTEGGTTVSLASTGDITATIAQEIDKIGSFSLAGNYQSGEAYKDPYQIGVPRRKTDENTSTLTFRYDNILETGVSLGYALKSIDLDDDRSGKNNPLLARDGQVHSYDLGAMLPLGETHLLGAQVLYERGDIDGDSNAYDAYGLSLSHTYNGKALIVETSLSAQKGEYDKAHPLFGKTREENTYALTTSLTWLNPFDWEGFFVTVNGTYAVCDANIDFFDSTDTMIGMGVGFKF